MFAVCKRIVKNIALTYLLPNIASIAVFLGIGISYSFSGKITMIALLGWANHTVKTKTLLGRFHGTFLLWSTNY